MKVLQTSRAFLLEHARTLGNSRKSRSRLTISGAQTSAESDRQIASFARTVINRLLESTDVVYEKNHRAVLSELTLTRKAHDPGPANRFPIRAIPIATYDVKISHEPDWLESV